MEWEEQVPTEAREAAAKVLIEAAGGKVPEGLPEPEPETEEPSPEETPAETDEEDTGDTIETLTEKLQELENQLAGWKGKEGELRKLEEDLKPAAKVRELLKSSGFRGAMEKALRGTESEGFEWGAQGDDSDVERVAQKFQDPRVDELKQDISGMKGMLFEIATQRDRARLDGMYEEFAGKYGQKDEKGKETLVTPKLWKQIETEAAQKHGDNLTLDLIGSHAAYRLLPLIKNGGSNNGQAQKVLEQLAKEPKGTRVVSGPGPKRQSAELGAPKGPMTRDQRLNLLTKAIQG